MPFNTRQLPEELLSAVFYHLPSSSDLATLLSARQAAPLLQAPAAQQVEILLTDESLDLPVRAWKAFPKADGLRIHSSKKESRKGYYWELPKSKAALFKMLLYSIPKELRQLHLLVPMDDMKAAAKAIARAACTQKLEELRVENSCVPADIVSRMVKGLTNLRSLSVPVDYPSKSSIGSVLGNIAAYSRLQALGLHCLQCTPDCWMALSKLPDLRELSCIFDVHFWDADLPPNTTITKLVVGTYPPVMEGIMLDLLPNLTHADLHGFDMCVSHMLRGHPRVTFLSLDAGSEPWEAVTRHGDEDIFSSMASLQELHIANESIHCIDDQLVKASRCSTLRVCRVETPLDFGDDIGYKEDARKKAKWLNGRGLAALASGACRLSLQQVVLLTGWAYSLPVADVLPLLRGGLPRLRHVEVQLCWWGKARLPRLHHDDGKHGGYYSYEFQVADVGRRGGKSCSRPAATLQAAAEARLVQLAGLLREAGCDVAGGGRAWVDEGWVDYQQERCVVSDLSVAGVLLRARSFG